MKNYMGRPSHTTIVWGCGRSFHRNVRWEDKEALEYGVYPTREELRVRNVSMWWDDECSRRSCSWKNQSKARKAWGKHMRDGGRFTHKKTDWHKVA